MEHGLEVFVFYVQKHITPCTVVINSLLVRNKQLGVPASVKQVYLAYHVKLGHTLNQSCSVQSHRPERAHQNNELSWQSSRTNHWLLRLFWKDKIVFAL